MTTPELTHAREQSQFHLETLDVVTDMIRDTFPAAANLDCHRQMRDILTRVKDTLHHPILFAAHIIVYLVKAARYSRRWATLVKNIAALDPSLFKTHSSASSLKSQASRLTPSPASSLQTQDSRLQTPFPTPQHSALRTQHSLQTRLRIRAFAQALQHERRLAEKLPPSIPKPDLTPILPVHHNHSVLTTQSSVLSSHSSLLSLKPKAYSLQPVPPLFPSEAFWESKVRSLQLKILGNITRIFPALGRAYLKQYNASISATPSTSSHASSSSHSSHSSLPSSSSLKSQASPPSYSSHPSHPSHSSPPPVSTSQSTIHNPQSAILTPLSHPPP